MLRSFQSQSAQHLQEPPKGSGVDKFTAAIFQVPASFVNLWQISVQKGEDALKTYWSEILTKAQHEVEKNATPALNAE